MKTFRLIYLSLAALLLSACQAEIWEPAGENILNPNSDESPVLTISSKSISAINASQTKAENTNPELDKILSKINDLNIRVLLNDDTHFTLFCNNNKIVSSDKNQTTKYLQKNLYTQNDGQVQIHLEKLKSSQVDRIEVIANYGSSLASTEDWSTVKENGAYDPSDPAKDYCLMYGSTSTPEETSIPSHPKCKNYAIKLKRSRAMFSVMMIDNGIAEGLTVTPKFIRFYNMPTECSITALGTETGNKITVDTQVAPMQEKIVSAGSLVGTGAVSNPPKSIGTHDETTPIRVENFFFPFENKQGDNPNSTTKDKTKYPKEITDFPEDQRVAQAKLQKNIFKYTYLEIEADYIYRTGGQVTVGGTVIYRLFLGANTIDNFDIVGNTYYRVNLYLKEFAGAAEDGKVVGGTVVANDADNSWRVDMETQSWGFDKSQYDFDAHRLDGYTTVVGTNWKFIPRKGDDGGDSWLVLNIEHQKELGDWANPTDIASKSAKLKIENGRLKFNLQPMTYGSWANRNTIDPAGQFNENTYKDKGHNYREILIDVQNTDTKEIVTVTVRQYAPIAVRYDGELYFMERFEEYDEDANGNQIVGYPWKWQDKDISTALDYNMGHSESFSYTGSTPLKLLDQAKNGIMLTYRQKNQKESGIEGEGGAVGICTYKGHDGSIQGAHANTYTLCSKEVLEAMFAKSKEYHPDWGPFEPLHVYESYWTIDVPSSAKTSTYYYDPNATGTDKFKTTTDRNQLKRIRAVYAPNGYYNGM